MLPTKEIMGCIIPLIISANEHFNAYWIADHEPRGFASRHQFERVV